MNYLKEQLKSETLYGVRALRPEKPRIMLAKIFDYKRIKRGRFSTIDKDGYTNMELGTGVTYVKNTYSQLKDDGNIVRWLHNSNYMLISKETYDRYMEMSSDPCEFDDIVNEINSLHNTYFANIKNGAKQIKDNNVDKVEKNSCSLATESINPRDVNMECIKQYARTSNDYRNFLSLYEKYKDLKFATIYHAVTGSGSITASDSDKIRSGKLKCSDAQVRKATQLLDYESKFINIANAIYGRQDYFYIAIAFCFYCKEVDNDELLKKLRNNSKKGIVIKSIGQAIDRIESIYNCRRSPEQKVFIKQAYERDKVKKG